MNTLLWFGQIFIAVVLVPIGGATVLGLLQKASAKRGQPLTVPDGLLRFIGAAELAGAIGVVVPWATGIAPWLTPMAALGLVPIMVGASVVVTRAPAGQRPRGPTDRFDTHLRHVTMGSDWRFRDER